MKELETSLKRLKTDHLDLYQMHYLRDLNEVEQAFGPGGVMETFIKAKEEGKIRHLGFSAHTTLAALNAMKQFRFDTVMFPINFIEHFAFGFGHAVLELAHNQGVSVIAIKPTSGGGWAKDVPQSERYWWFRILNSEPEISMALRFSLSQKNVVTAMPAASLENFNNAVQVGKKYRPISNQEMKNLHSLAKKCSPLFLSQQKKAYMSNLNNDELCEESQMC